MEFFAIGLATASTFGGLPEPKPFQPGLSHIDPGLMLTPATRPKLSKAIAKFSFQNRQIDLFAEGRSSSIDSQFLRDELRTARTFAEMMPGYPQPARVTVRLQISF
ncbi:MAG: hypothetical protein AAFR21_10595 [Pseudomonadota bacterium]